MNCILRAILLHLLSQRRIGGKHLPEKRIVKSKTKWATPKNTREFQKEYKQMINEGFICRLKKRTGKEQEWHISLNPSRLRELHLLLYE